VEKTAQNKRHTLQAFQLWMTTEGRKPTTVYQYSAAVRSLIRTAEGMDPVRLHAAYMARKPSTRRVVAAAWHAFAAYMKASGRTIPNIEVPDAALPPLVGAAAVLLLSWSRLSVSQLNGLLWRDMGEHGGTWYVFPPGGEARKLPPEVADVLVQLRAWVDPPHDAAPLFAVAPGSSVALPLAALADLVHVMSYAAAQQCFGLAQGKTAAERLAAQAAPVAPLGPAPDMLGDLLAEHPDLDVEDGSGAIYEDPALDFEAHLNLPGADLPQD